MSALPQEVRRIVTGHDANGKAIIESDTHLTPFNPIKGTPVSSFLSNSGEPDPFSFTVIHRTSAFPASNTEPPVEYHGKKISLEHEIGTTCRVVDFTPLKAGEDGMSAEGFMHRTQSLDFGVVLKGEIVLELDDGLETTVKEGDVVVQRGTIHAWKNVSKENCRVLFVLIPAEKVQNKSTGEDLEITPTPTLVDEKDG